MVYPVHGPFSRSYGVGVEGEVPDAIYMHLLDQCRVHDVVLVGAAVHVGVAVSPAVTWRAWFPGEEPDRSLLQSHVWSFANSISTLTTASLKPS